MKYHNKQKRYRLSEWTQVSVNTGALTFAKRWCQQHPSPGKFFVGPYTGEWWFEHAEDALAFKLAWEGKYR